MAAEMQHNPHGMMELGGAAWRAPIRGPHSRCGDIRGVLTCRRAARRRPRGQGTPRRCGAQAHAHGPPFPRCAGRGAVPAMHRTRRRLDERAGSPLAGRARGRGSRAASFTIFPTENQALGSAAGGFDGTEMRRSCGKGRQGVYSHAAGLADGRGGGGGKLERSNSAEMGDTRERDAEGAGVRARARTCARADECSPGGNASKRREGGARGAQRHGRAKTSQKARSQNRNRHQQTGAVCNVHFVCLALRDTQGDRHRSRCRASSACIVCY